MLEFRKAEANDYEKGEAPRITETDREWIGEVVKVELVTNKQHPDWSPSYRVIFRIVEEPFVGAFASGFMPTVWFPEKKLDNWLKAFGIDVSKSNFPDKFQLDTDQLRRKIARIRVKLNKDGFANVPEIYPMDQRDYKRIAEGALKGRTSTTTASTAPATTVTQASVPTTPTAQPVTPPAVAPAPVVAPVVQGQVTKDSSIPF